MKLSYDHLPKCPLTYPTNYYLWSSNVSWAMSSYSISSASLFRYICSPTLTFTFVSVHPTWINLVLLYPLSWICPAQVLWTRKFYEIWLFSENVSFDPTRVSSCLLPFLSQCSWQRWHSTCWWTPRTAPSLCSQPTPCHEGCFSSDSPT